MSPTKVCTKCGVEYPATKEFFRTDKSRKYGLHAHCKKCSKLNHLKWCKENSEKVKAYSRKYNAENREKVKAGRKKYRENNHEKIIYQDTEYRLKTKIGATPPPELVEIKTLINKTKRLCKTLKN